MNLRKDRVLEFFEYVERKARLEKMVATTQLMLALVPTQRKSMRRQDEWEKQQQKEVTETV